MKVKSRNMLRVPGWFNQEKAVRSRITHKIYRCFAPVLISIKISNTRIIDSKIELPFNQFAIWLMREQIVTEPIWRPSHPSRVRGLKSRSKGILPSTGTSRTLHGCVDWNHEFFRFIVWQLERRTLHGCVDWNIMPYQNKPNDTLVAPFTGVWIEIGCTSAIPGPASVAPFTGAWIEISSARPVRRPCPASHPSRVRGLKSHAQIAYQRV